MPRNDRIPAGVRREINRIGPGKYADPRTGRIYVDSADMDDSFEEMIDGVKAADEKRDAEKELGNDRERPPVEIEELAVQQSLRHAQRMEDQAWTERAGNRRKHLLGKRKWKRGLGEELDEEEIEELAAIDAALKEEPNDDTREEVKPA